MRSILTSFLLPLSALLAPTVLAGNAALNPQPRGLLVNHLDPKEGFAEFLLPCSGCFELNPEGTWKDEYPYGREYPSKPEVDFDESIPHLQFLLQVDRSNDISTSNLLIRGDPVPIVWKDFLTESSGFHVSAYDPLGNYHDVTLSWIGIVSAPTLALSVPGYATQTVHFTILEVDHVPIHSGVGFTVVMRPTTSEHRMVSLIPDSTSEIVQLGNWEGDFAVLHDSDANEFEDFGDRNSFDLSNELETLGLLEARAEDLRVQIATQKKIISEKLKDNREKKCLRHLMQECDGVLCKAKVVTQRICDKVGINVKSDFRYTRMSSYDAYSFRVNKHGENSEFWEHTKSMMHGSSPANVPLMLPKGGAQQSLHTMEIVGPPNPLTPILRVLEVIATVFGLTALWVLIKRKCMSARTRAERRADLEERKNARAYRRAARRARVRKNFNSFINAFNCFKRSEEPRVEDYEEKRALILQDALLEQDLDQAEKGEVMEAEIRELRYAHEIISSLVRVDENRYDLVTPLHDPPPLMVPLPYTSATERSRSRASLHTLPSYTSETLPDYSSQRPSTHTRRSSSSTIGFTPSTTDTEAASAAGPSRSENSGSSVIEMSPRPSAETLRTRPSTETPYR